MIFKGGTSLSKVYGLIDRFSEDIDLILDWRLLGYGLSQGSDPYQNLPSKTQRSRYNQEMNARTAEYIREKLLAQLNLLLASAPGIIVSVDESDPHTVNVRYPASFAVRKRIVRAQCLPGIRVIITTSTRWRVSVSQSLVNCSGKVHVQYNLQNSLQFLG
jgi:hypothetical protein